MTQKELEARIQELEQKLAQANAAKASIKLSKAGYIEVYGLKGKGRFPVSCTDEGFAQLFAMQGAIDSFIKANHAAIKQAHTDYRNQATG